MSTGGESSRRRLGRTALGATLLAASLALAGCAENTGSGGSGDVAVGPLKIMILAPITLASAPYQNAVDALNARIGLVNAQGGIKGRHVEVIPCDSQNDVNVAAQCARRATTENVVAFVGNQDYNGASIWPVIEQAGIPVIGLRQVNELDNVNRYAFPIDASGPLTYAASSAYLAKNEGCASVGWMGVDYGAASQAAIAQSKDAAVKQGARWGSTQLFSANAADLAPQAALALKEGDCFILAAGNLSPRAAQAIHAINPAAHMIGTPDSLGGYLSQDAYREAATSVTQLSSLPSLQSTAAGVAIYRDTMAKAAPRATLNNVSLRAWTAGGVFAQVAGAVDDPVTAKSVYDQLLRSTAITTDGITADIDFSKAKPYGPIQRQFNTSLEASKIVNGQLTEQGQLFDGLALVNGSGT